MELADGTKLCHFQDKSEIMKEALDELESYRNRMKSYTAE